METESNPSTNNTSQTNTKSSRKISAGWIVAIAGACLLFVTSSFQYIFGVFVTPLAVEFDWSRTLISGSVSGRSVVSGVWAGFVGPLCDKYGPRRFIIVGILFTSLAYLLGSLLTNVWELYAFFSFMIGIGLTSSFIPMVATVNRWFGKKAAMANGIVMAGFGIAQVILPPILTFIIVHYNWRWSFLFLGLLVLVIGFVSLRFIKLPASVIAPALNNSTAVSNKPVSKEYTLREVLHVPTFWILFVINGVVFMAYQMTAIHVVSAAIDVGITAESAAIILTVGGIGSTCGRLIMAALATRISTRFVLMACLVLQSFALFFIMNAHTLLVFCASITFLGLGYGGTIPTMPTMAGRFFGTKSIGSIFSTLNIAQNIGLFTGPLLAGYVFDHTQSYFIAFLTATIAMVFSLLLSLLVRRPKSILPQSA